MSKTALALAIIAALIVASVLLSATGARRTSRPLAAAMTHADWSAPQRLTDCSASAPPQVLFPQETPFRRTGDGAIVFVSDACPLGAATAGPTSPHGNRPASLHQTPAPAGESVALAPIGPDDRLAPPRILQHDGGEPWGLHGLLATAATTKGQVVLLVGHSHRSTETVAEGPASGSLYQPLSWPGVQAPGAATSAYLGDVALAACGAQPGRDGGVQLRFQRHFQSAFGAPTALTGTDPSPAPCGALTLALDYRTDALAIWWHSGWLYARERQETGRLGPLQRFARASSEAQLTAVVSDDGRAIVAWVDPHGSRAALHLDISAPGMLLGPGRVIERLRWSAGRPPTTGWARLARLSSEGVLMAWTGTQSGHFVVRRASITLGGPRALKTLSPPGQSAVLQDLATGPHDDALLLWTAVEAHHRSGPTIVGYWTASYMHRAPTRPQPEVLAHVLATSARAAIDPGTGTAIVAWREPNGAIRYARGRLP